MWIHNLLDGELSAHDEPSLFGELSVNADLRHEFKQQLAIRSAVQNDRMALVPPAHLTNTVFSGLGFAAPMAGAAAGAAGGGFLLPWLVKLGLPLLSAAAAIGVTMAVSSSPENSTVADNRNQPGIVGSNPQSTTQPNELESRGTGVSGQSTYAQSSAQTNAQSSAQTNAQSNVSTQSNDNEAQLNALRRENRRLRNELANAQTPDQPLAVDGSQTPERDGAQRVEPSTPSAQPDVPAFERMGIAKVDVNNTMTFAHDDDLQAIETQIMPATMTYTAYPSPIAQVRGFAASHLNDVNVPAQSSWYDNIAVAFAYELTPHWAVGAEFVGGESFSQRFEGQSNGQIIRYEQRPSTYSIGPILRYTASPIGKIAAIPFFQVMAGGTEFGPIGRFTAGMQYNLSGPISLLAGLEYTMLGYKFQDSWFTSSKIGFTYGLAVRL